MHLKISYSNIMHDYQNIDNFLKEILDKLFNEKSSDCFEIFNINNILKEAGKNDYSALSAFKNCCGVYIFLTEDNEPAYVGFGGEKNQDLFGRIVYKQFRGDTLEKNIREMESLPIEHGIKQIIKEYTPKLLVIPVGRLNDSISIHNTKVLETILIALLNCKYNKK